MFWFIFQSLLSTTSFGIGCNYLARYEEQGVGAQWSNLFSSPVAGDGFSLGFVITMMFIDAVIYGMLTWYIEAVLPGTSLPQPKFIMTFQMTFVANRIVYGIFIPLWFMMKRK